MATNTSLILLLVSVIELFLFSNVHSITYWGDVRALKQFKNGIVSNSVIPGSCLSSWDFSLDPCDHLFGEKFTCGFRCDVVTANASRVTELGLDQAGYSGQLGSSSWNLPYLQSLDLSNNNFTGPIPNTLSNLTRLQKLTLSHNSLSGPIPSSIGNLSNLEEIYLDSNGLSGDIPLSLNGLKNLKRLELQGNKFTGQFPNLGQLRNLSFIDASDNSISGELPTDFPANLFEISMRNNQLQGIIPEKLATNLVYLQVLDLTHNRLSGSVPWTLFTHPSLQQLNLSYNQFWSVQVPGTSGIRSELIAIDLSNNQIRGFLPGFMGLMPKLSSLYLENNKFTGMIPTQYAVKAVVPEEGVAAFERLLLGGNYLLGSIPGPLMNLKPGSAMVSLVDNCLYRCPVMFFFCEGGEQKSLQECKNFGPVIP